MTGLHQAIKKKSQNGLLKLADLKPNSREVAKRMISNGELVASGVGYVWHEVKR
jgi:hypothetical protein